MPSAHVGDGFAADPALHLPQLGLEICNLLCLSCSTVRFSSAWTAIIRIPSRSPEVMVVGDPMVPTASWSKAAKKSYLCNKDRPREEPSMPESVYKIVELVGTSTESWEKAAAAAVQRAGKSLRDLRIAEVAQLDLQIEKGKVKAYRARLKVSFKYEGD